MKTIKYYSFGTALLISGAVFLNHASAVYAPTSPAPTFIPLDSSLQIEERSVKQDVDYLSQMIDACFHNDSKKGKDLEVQRNIKIIEENLAEPQISFDDLVDLSMIIDNEAGSNWLSTEWRMKVGEVLLNRVASPEFPSTLQECIYAPNAYDIRDASSPSLECIAVAARLLSGERIINDPSVVFQANFPQGSGIYEVLHDDILGNTYLCYSNNPHVYT